MCNLYSLTSSQRAIRDLTRAMLDSTGNLPLSLRAEGTSGGDVLAEIATRTLRPGDVRDLLLAGRAAEVELLGEPSSGASGGADSDLARATALAATAITSFSFDQEMAARAHAGRTLVHRALPDAQANAATWPVAMKRIADVAVLWRAARAARRPGHPEAER